MIMNWKWQLIGGNEWKRQEELQENSDWGLEAVASQHVAAASVAMVAQQVLLAAS